MKDALDHLIASSSLLQAVPAGLVYMTAILLIATVILTFVAVVAGETVWIERRVSGRMQARIGPNRVGYQGLLQFLADGLKLLSKEDVVPASADRPIFLFAPYIVFAGAFAAFAAIPFGQWITSGSHVPPEYCEYRLNIWKGVLNATAHPVG